MCRAPTRHASEARSALHRHVPLRRSLLALGALLREPPLEPRFCHRWLSFRHAFTNLVGPLDPSTYRLFAGALRPHAACRLLQLSRSTSTPTSRPVPFRFLRRRAAARQGGRSSDEDYLPSFPRPGATERIRPAPIAATARRNGFTPTCSTRTPLVTSSCPAEPGKRLGATTVR